jgi:hypothetical protein
MEEEPSVRMQTRRLDGLNIRSEHGGEEENRIFQPVANNFIHYVTRAEILQMRLMFACPCIIDINNIDNQLDATVTAY